MFCNSASRSPRTLAKACSTKRIVCACSFPGADSESSTEHICMRLHKDDCIFEKIHYLINKGDKLVQKGGDVKLGNSYVAPIRNPSHNKIGYF